MGVLNATSLWLEPRAPSSLDRPILRSILERVGMHRSLLPDELLCNALVPGEAFCLVVQGVLRATILQEDGQMVVMRDLVRGDSIGDAALLEDGGALEVRSPTVVAVTPARVLIAPGEFVRFYVANQAAFWLEESRYLNYCVSKMAGRLLDLSAPSLPQRLAQFLCNSAQERPDGRYEVKVSHEELGRAVRAHRCSVTRTLQDLAECGVISLGRRIIVIEAIEQLRLAARTLD